MRVHVTGNAGAGKTTLARQIGARYGLPVHHLDSIVWGPHWTKTPADVRDAKTAALLRESRWVIEGVSVEVRERADVVLWLDTPRATCLYRVVKRCFQVGFRTRPELPANCPEIKILWRALLIVWRFPQRVGSTLRRESAAPHFLICRDGVDALAQLEHFALSDKLHR